MLNYIWMGLILVAVLLGGSNGRLKEVTDAAFEGAKTAVMSIALPLVGIMALWLGIMRIAERAGIIQAVASAIQPLLRALFPDVPRNHPAMGSMVMNIAANMLGLSNAATPLGLKAMADLERLNPHPGTATNAMCTFLAINTSSIQLIPTTAIAIMAAAGALNPSAIVGTSLLATFCSTAAAIIAVKVLEKLPIFQSSTIRPEAGQTISPLPQVELAPSTDAPAQPRVSSFGRLILFSFILVFGWFFWKLTMTIPQTGPVPAAAIRALNAGSLLAIPFVIAWLPLYGVLAGVRVYETFVEGAKEGFEIAIRIIPFLVAILVAIGMFRAAGGIDVLARWLAPILSLVGIPVELLPMILVRPLSGSATTGLFTDLVRTFGPDHMISLMGGTIFGSTETTFYVIAVYFGAVGIRRMRHAIAAGLLADAVGVAASIVICRWVFG
jgi:spore maturation protein SpmA